MIARATVCSNLPPTESRPSTSQRTRADEPVPMNAPPIAFASRAYADDEVRWLDALRAAAPELRIEPLDALDAAARDHVRVAIVADPDPAGLRALPNLVWVQSLWAGVERLVTELGDADIGIARFVDPSLSDTMAEAVLAWTLWLHRDGPRYARQQRERTWHAHRVLRPAARTVGVLGLGALGAASAVRLVGQGFDVVGWTRSARDERDVPAGVRAHDGDAGLERVLAASDVLVVLLPLTDDTRGLLDAGRLALLPRGASLINFARGPIVDPEALLVALDGGALEHAVLDVFAEEPLPEADPMWAHPRVTVLPHVSAPTDLPAAAACAAANVRRYLADGALPGLVDPVRGY